MRVGPLLLSLAALSGCSTIPWALAAPQEDEVTVLPTEEGNTYVHVASQRNASQSYLRSRWKREARTACRGDYMVLYEDRTARQTGGEVSGRTHAGYVRCVDPEAANEQASKLRTKAS